MCVGIYRVGIQTCFEQHSGDLGVPLYRGPHQRRHVVDIQEVNHRAARYLRETTDVTTQALILGAETSIGLARRT